MVCHVRGKPAVTDWRVVAREAAATRRGAPPAHRAEPPAPGAPGGDRAPDPGRPLLRPARGRRRRRRGCSSMPRSPSATRTAAPGSNSRARPRSDPRMRTIARSRGGSKSWLTRGYHPHLGNVTTGGQADEAARAFMESGPSRRAEGAAPRTLRHLPAGSGRLAGGRWGEPASQEGRLRHPSSASRRSAASAPRRSAPCAGGFLRDRCTPGGWSRCTRGAVYRMCCPRTPAFSGRTPNSLSLPFT